MQAILITAATELWVCPCLFSLEQETAVNIAVSCRLVANPDDVMMLNVDDKAESERARGRSAPGLTAYVLADPPPCFRLLRRT